MTNYDFCETIDELSKVDLSEYLWPGRPLSEAMEEIDAIYDIGLFGGLTEDEFADYIRKEYGVKCFEKTILIIK